METNCFVVFFFYSFILARKCRRLTNLTKEERWAQMIEILLDSNFGYKQPEQENVP